VVLVVSNLSGSTTFLGLAVRVVGSVLAGGVVFGASAVVLGRRAEHRPRHHAGHDSGQRPEPDGAPR
jgi:hypothetical protein